MGLFESQYYFWCEISQVLRTPTSFPLFQHMRQSTLSESSPWSQVTGRKAAGVCVGLHAECAWHIQEHSLSWLAVPWPLSLLESTGCVQVIGEGKSCPVGELWGVQ